MACSAVAAWRGALRAEDGRLPLSRERLLASPHALEDGELVGVLFGGRDRTVRALGQSLLAAADGLRALASLEPSELCNAGGLGRERAAQVLAALELGRRVHLVADGRPRLRTPRDVFIPRAAPRAPAARVFRVLAFNARNVLLADATGGGWDDGRLYDRPREVFGPAAVGAGHGGHLRPQPPVRRPHALPLGRGADPGAAGRGANFPPPRAGPRGGRRRAVRLAGPGRAPARAPGGLR